MVKIIIPLVLTFFMVGLMLPAAIVKADAPGGVGGTTPATISQITDIIMWFIYIIIVLALSELLIIKMLLGWLQR